MQGVINQDKLLRLLRLTPLILVITGFVLILVGNIASLKSCKVAGAVVVAVGGLFSLFFAAWSSRQDKFVENTNCEEHSANRTALSTGCNDQLGPIHHFEVKTPSKSSWKEIVPPSYEEAVDINNGIGNSQTSTQVVPSDSNKSSLDNTTSAPASYEERHENAKTAS